MTMFMTLFIFTAAFAAAAEYAWWRPQRRIRLRRGLDEDVMRTIALLAQHHDQPLILRLSHQCNPLSKKIAGVECVTSRILDDQTT